MPLSHPLLPATLWQGITLEWLWVYHGTVPRVREWSGEITVPAGVFFVKSGLARINAGGKEVRIPPGQAFLSAPGSRRQWFEAETRLLSVGFRCQWPDGTPVFSAGLNAAVPEKDIAPLHTATLRLFRAIHGGSVRITYREAITPHSPRSIQDWCAYDAAYRRWFAEYAHALAAMGVAPALVSGSPNHRLQRLLQKLSEWPLDQPLNLKSLTAGLNLGVRRAHDLLRANLGLTPQAAHERRRLDHARQRLIQEDVALKEIAFALGFRHPPHFTTWFKRHTGVTPTAYRISGGIHGA